MAPESYNRLKKIALAIFAITALVLLLLYLQGTLGGRKVGPGTTPLPESAPPAGKTAVVRREEVDEILTWPGTVRSRTLSKLAPKITARVLAVKVEVGDAVKKGEVLAVLDDRALKAQLGAARAALSAAEAQAVRAEADARRLQGLFAKEAATQQDLDAAKAQARSSRARVAEARDSLREAESLLSETTVRAPFDGVIVERHAQPGNMALPGVLLVTIQEPKRLRIEANIPESCARLIQLGMEVKVRIASPVTRYGAGPVSQYGAGPERELTATVEEIAPAADPETRTVLIKARLEPIQDLQPGMFGWLYQACGKREALLIPSAAVIRIGQIESVRLITEGVMQTRLVRTGKTYGEEIEVLSGLKEGDVILLRERTG